MAKKSTARFSIKKISLISSGGVILIGIAFVLWVLRPLPSPLLDGSGSCIIRGEDGANASVNMPEAGAPNIGTGYAKLQKPGIQTIEGLKSVCSRADFERLALNYCLRDSQPFQGQYQEEVAIYTKSGEPFSSTCGALGCDYRYCFSFTHDGLLRDIQYLLFSPRQFQSQTNPAFAPRLQTGIFPTPIVKAFVSPDLGISFSYIPFFPNGIGQYFFTKEIGDTVYLYWNPPSKLPFSGTDAEFLQTIAPGSKYVEVFNKDPQLSLQDAIKQQFLTGYAETDCFVKATPYGHPREDESFQTAVIDYSRHSNSYLTRRQLDALVAKCPKYVTFNGVSYFMMDPKHPNKLLFIELGQDNLPSGVGGLMWDGTIKVLQ